jgi:hypothetical protein
MRLAQFTFGVGHGGRGPLSPFLGHPLLDYDVFVPRYAYPSLRLFLTSRFHLSVSTWFRRTLYLRDRSFCFLSLFSLR